MRFWFYLISASFAFFVSDLRAHAPYEREAGQFTRKDGVTITAVLYYVDGISGRDPVTVQFRSGDGAVIAKTEPTTDEVIVRSSVDGFRIYTYESDWIPVASAVRAFDGYGVTYSRDLSRAWSSILIHTREHLLE